MMHEPMISNRDVFRSAQLLVEKHGDEALIYAAMKADDMLEHGDLDGQAVWMRILGAVKELLWKDVPADAVKH